MKKFGSTSGFTRRDALKAVAVAGAASAVGISAPAIAKSPTILRFGHTTPAKTTYNQAILKFGEELAKLSSNRYKLEVFPSSQLGPLAEMLQAVKTGTLDFAMAVPAWYSSFIKPIDVFTLPYLVDSPERLKKGLDGQIGDHVKVLGRKAGFEFFGYWLAGSRNIVNRVRTISKPADVKGLKLRVINSQVYVATFRALGANPIAMDSSEIYLAVQQGVVDGFDYAIPDLFDQKMYEVVNHMTLDAHTVDFFFNATSPATLAKFPAEDQALLRQAMQTAVDWQWKVQPQEIEHAQSELAKRMKITPLTSDQRQAFIDKTRPVYSQFENVIGKDWIDLCIKNLSA